MSRASIIQFNQQWTVQEEKYLDPSNVGAHLELATINQSINQSSNYDQPRHWDFIRTGAVCVCGPRYGRQDAPLRVFYHSDYL